MSLDVEPQVITEADYTDLEYKVYAKASFGKHVFMTPIYTVDTPGDLRRHQKNLDEARLKAALALAKLIGRSLSQE